MLGNVAIVDCNYFFADLLDGYQRKIIKNVTDPQEKIKLLLLIETIRLYLAEEELTSCDFPFELDGVLKN